MYITVYAIAKDEEEFAERFAKSTAKADKVVVLDTGSTDKTIEILRQHGVTVKQQKINPWRFDVARNESMKLIPKKTDIAIAMDLDDIMVDNWRELVEENWEKGMTQLRYQYPYSHFDEAQTEPSLIVYGFKVHCPTTYYWKNPVHEYLLPHEGKEEVFGLVDEPLLIHQTKVKEERKTRLPLFKMGLDEDPTNERLQHLYGRELMFDRQFDQAIVELKKHLAITPSYPEGEDFYMSASRARSCLYIADCLIGKNADPNEIMVWLIRAVAESPGERDTWMYLARGWFNVKDYKSAYACVHRALSITERSSSPETLEWCWGERAEDFRKAITSKFIDDFVTENIPDNVEN